TLQDAFDLDALKALDIIVTCQGGDYTNEIYPKLRASGWQGYWIDAASSLRMKDDAIIILDPVNQDVITAGLNNGVKTFVGGNCTVS
ncbi:aspartate-semialdehyde dehydrogenase, partial [Acinetobacter baumannii]|nr:aspartate-semialdehyde dehydrogenase [Acinetobacter baumannii]